MNTHDEEMEISVKDENCFFFEMINTFYEYLVLVNTDYAEMSVG